MQHGTAITDGVDVGGAGSKDGAEAGGNSRVHWLPGCSIPLQDHTAVTHREDEGVAA